MYKLIDSSSFFDQEELQVTILNAPGAVDHLVKAAADERVRSYVLDELKIDPGKMYLHINAMGAGEYYGPNRNGDYFPEATLKQYYKTFETSPAHVFRHHINKDPAKAIGKVVFALYNERMHRVELVAEVDRQLGSDIEARMAHGEFPATSMACKTPYDICSICNNQAHTRQEYCVHLKQHLGRIMPDGKRVMAINEAPLRFFDISIVIKPADITSSVLQKVANTDPAISSLILAEEEGIGFSSDREKSASLAKVSEMIKEIEGYVQGADPSFDHIMSQVRDPEVDTVKRLDAVPLEDLFQTFGELGISPSLKFLAEIIAHRMGHHTPGVGDEVIHALHESKLSGATFPTVEMEVDREINPIVKNALSYMQASSSLFPDFIEKRASVGYAGMGPKIQMNEAEIRADERRRVASEGSSVSVGSILNHPVTTLLTIGGAALWAKAYINSIIEKRLREMHSPVRPTIVKMASVSGSNSSPVNGAIRKAEMKALTKAVSSIPSAGGTGKKVSMAIKLISSAHDKISNGLSS